MKNPSIRKTLEPQHIVAIIDSREKTPADLSPLRTKVDTLKTGDYSVAGLENHIAIERKSLADLVMCVGRERERFEAECQRLLAYETRAIVVEGAWMQIELKQYRGDIHPNAALGSLLGWVAQGIPILMCDNHERAGRFISRILFTAARRRWNQSYGFVEKMADLTE